jgi:hypothetical protein
MSTDVSEVRAASIIALMIEATRTSETSVDIYLTTRRYIPEDNSEHHTRRRENLKPHTFQIYLSNFSGVCYNEQFLSIKSGCYNENRCYNERGGP